MSHILMNESWVMAHRYGLRATCATDNKTTKSIGLIRIRIATLFIENDQIHRMRINPILCDMCLLKTPALFVENDKIHRMRISPMICNMCLFKTPALFVENDKIHRMHISPMIFGWYICVSAQWILSFSMDSDGVFERHISHTWLTNGRRISHVTRTDELWRMTPVLSWETSFAKEPYKRDDILQKRPIILSILLSWKLNESWFMANDASHVTRTNESWRMIEWVMSHELTNHGEWRTC